MKGEEAEEKKSKLISNFTQLKPVVHLSSKKKCYTLIKIV